MVKLSQKHTVIINNSIQIKIKQREIFKRFRIVALINPGYIN